MSDWSTLTLEDLREIAAKAKIDVSAGAARLELLEALSARAERDPLVREMLEQEIEARTRLRPARALEADAAQEGSPQLPGSSPGPGVFAAASPPWFVDRGKPIPDTYGDDVLRFMVRDPWTGFLYWELAGPLADRLRLAYGASFLEGAAWRLRIVALHERAWFEVAIPAQARSAYVTLRPGTPYLASLGFVDPDGAFVEVLKAGPVYTPRAGVSSVVDEEWAVDAKHVEAMGGPAVRGGGSSCVWQVRLGVPHADREVRP